MKNRGKELLFQGCFLGDASGKVKKVEEKSAFAIWSKNAEYSIKFESREKKNVFNKIKKRRKEYSDERIFTIMHAVSIYFATKGFVKTAPKFYICSEGFNVRNLTLEVKKLLGMDFDSKKFVFRSLKEMFGKHNPADKLAGKVRKGSKSANLILKENQFKKLNII